MEPFSSAMRAEEAAQAKGRRGACIQTAWGASATGVTQPSGPRPLFLWTCELFLWAQNQRRGPVIRAGTARGTWQRPKTCAHCPNPKIYRCCLKRRFELHASTPAVPSRRRTCMLRLAALLRSAPGSALGTVLLGPDAISWVAFQS